MAVNDINLPPQQAEPPAQLDAPTPDERALRRLLGRITCGRSLYTDDGECSDAGQYPAIDFLRDSPQQIETMLKARKATALPDAAREAMQMALDALENAIDQTPKPYSTECARSADALRAQLDAK